MLYTPSSILSKHTNSFFEFLPKILSLGYSFVFVLNILSSASGANFTAQMSNFSFPSNSTVALLEQEAMYFHSENSSVKFVSSNIPFKEPIFQVHSVKFFDPENRRRKVGEFHRATTSRLLPTEKSKKAPKNPSSAKLNTILEPLPHKSQNFQIERRSNTDPNVNESQTFKLVANDSHNSEQLPLRERTRASIIDSSFRNSDLKIMAQMKYSTPSSTKVLPTLPTFRYRSQSNSQSQEMYPPLGTLGPYGEEWFPDVYKNNHRKTDRFVIATIKSNRENIGMAKQRFPTCFKWLLVIYLVDKIVS